MCVIRWEIPARRIGQIGQAVKRKWQASGIQECDKYDDAEAALGCALARAQLPLKATVRDVIIHMLRKKLYLQR